MKSQQAVIAIGLWREKQVQRGTGSGFIISNDGKIITNAHVVEGADKVTVTLKDGRTIDGKVLGSDPLTDVAVVQVETSNLPTVKLGNSDSLQVGEWAADRQSDCVPRFG